MARKRSSILSSHGLAPHPLGDRRASRTRLWLVLGVIAAVLVLAWFDGGEEPIHPIERDIPLPEAR